MEALRSPVARIRANPWLAVGIAALALLIIAWLGWAIYVGSDRGVNEGLGVLIAVPALLVALAIVSLPFLGGYLLVKRRETEDADAKDDASDDEDDDSEEKETKDVADEESEDDAGEESEPEAETAAS